MFNIKRSVTECVEPGRLFIPRVLISVRCCEFGGGIAYLPKRGHFDGDSMNTVTDDSYEWYSFYQWYSLYIMVPSTLMWASDNLGLYIPGRRRVLELYGCRVYTVDPQL